MTRIRRILHASDFSRASRAAFRQAVALARENRAALTIVHVHAPVVPPTGEAYALPVVYDKLLADVRGQAQRQLDRLAAKARAAGVAARTLLLEGTPHDRIVRAARAGRASLIVLGTHGRTGLGRVLVGSVAARVVALAHCPVLTVRGQ